jgi:F0F1-type ATP synthase assembly protein I
MMNKYMRRGIWLILVGVAFVLLGYYLMEEDIFKYGWAMIIGTLAFGIGFLNVIYSLIRKLDRRSILEERAGESEDDSAAVES